MYVLAARIAFADDFHSNMIILFVGKCDVLAAAAAAAAAAFYKVHTAPLAQISCVSNFCVNVDGLPCRHLNARTNAVKTTKQQTKMNDGKCYTKVLLIDPVRAIYYECANNRARCEEEEEGAVCVCALVVGLQACATKEL